VQRLQYLEALKATGLAELRTRPLKCGFDKQDRDGNHDDDADNRGDDVTENQGHDETCNDDRGECEAGEESFQPSKPSQLRRASRFTRGNAFRYDDLKAAIHSGPMMII
jgi:hypothetical protein